MKWDAKQYLKFEAERTQPARDLAARVTLEEECRKALDIGCGPGNSTRMVKQRFPEADVLGIDQSPEMIRAAREENPTLSFQVFDVTRDFTALGTDYDLVFSNACLQWVPGHEQLLPRLIGQYFDLLSASAGDFTMWETVYYHRLPSHQAILEWYRGTGLRPYLSCLTKENQRLFEREVLDGIARAYPVRQNGEVIFRFPRLFFTARR